MENYILIAIIALILTGAAICILRAKKKGKKCIGCPHSGNCTTCHDHPGPL